ncbi:OLC1v1034908C2 [Oldenlandia corymbosa var. corymbosa]|uniref:OLC1v1034908C2 n=1 Tax=Oldenlandia corymbosa var. corymbosa TaxID=529605 RepID=A0AAV1CRN2_OLDCO|nr:OLC1v1034908C2 [Oldenlandia corymbosa var. corymbosa]
MPVRVPESSSSTPSHVPGEYLEKRTLQPCTLLSVGQAFSGTQNVSTLQKDEAWRVNVRILGCDLDHGYLCGTMEALNVPMADTPVITFWEGEIVDSKNYTFFTSKWGATSEDDKKHWTKFPSFSPLLSQVEIDGGKSLDLSSYPYIFMVMRKCVFIPESEFFRASLFSINLSSLCCRDGKSNTL